MTNGETGGFLERLRNSPRTVSTIIVILIVIGAIFAFSDRGRSPEAVPSPTPASEEAPAAEVSPTPEGEATPTPEVKEEQAERTAPTPLPEAKETDAAYEEVAQRGEGVTHLARRALHRYLESHKPDFEVTGAHKVWMEDYLKDRVGRTPLALGEVKAVEKQQIQEAVEKSKSLSDAQLQSLQRFAQRVAAYR